MNSMYWCNSEIKLLLEVTLEYKKEKSKQNIDWRSHTSTYHDIWKAFLQVYPVKVAEEGMRHFPHDVEQINKAIIIFKLKDMRRRFHKYGFSHRFSPFFFKIWGKTKELCEESGEDSDVKKEEDDEVEKKIEHTKAALESESSDWSSTESEDCKDTKALSSLQTSTTKAPITAENAMHWTSSEIRVLLVATLQYKIEKSKQNIDWRSHSSTYHDIWKNFLQDYKVERAEEGVMCFPHDVEKINKAKIIFKVKDMRRRYKKSYLDRSGFIAECIWGDEDEEDEEDEEEDEEEDDLWEDYGEDSNVVVEEEEDEVVEDCKDTKAALESESSDGSSTESEDCKDTKAALESESSDGSSTESEDCKDTKAALESESSDWSSIESEDCRYTKAALESDSRDWSYTESEDETIKPPSKWRVFKDDTYYAELDLAWPVLGRVQKCPEKSV